MNTLSKTIRLFLDSIGRRSEYEFYLKKFQSDRSPCFALVIPDTAGVEESGDLMSFDLMFLLKLELCPLVVLCGADAERNAAELARHGRIEILGASFAEQEEEPLRDTLRQLVDAERIPVLVLPDTQVAEAVPRLCPRLARRVHLLRTAGMLHAPDGEKLFYYYLKRSEGMPMGPEDRRVVDWASAWLTVDPQLHISVSSPLYLLQEIFTVKGRGSIIRPGSTFLHVREVAQLDRDRLLALIQEAFGRALRDPDLLESADDFVVETGYRGAAVLEPHAAGKYLSKFAVGTQARGEGLAQELWETACEAQPRLFWRSRHDNPVNQWYERHATGHHREGGWTVYWKGIAAEDLPGIIRYALDRPGDFVS